MLRTVHDLLKQFQITVKLRILIGLGVQHFKDTIPILIDGILDRLCLLFQNAHIAVHKLLARLRRLRNFLDVYKRQLVHLFRRAGIGEQPLLAFSKACFLSLSLCQFLFLCHLRNLPDFLLMILGCAFSVLSTHGSMKAGL